MIVRAYYLKYNIDENHVFVNLQIRELLYWTGQWITCINNWKEEEWDGCISYSWPGMRTLHCKKML